MGTTLDVLFAPYGADLVTGEPYQPHPTQVRIREWCAKVRAGEFQEGGIPVLYVQHGVNSGGTRGAMAPVIEYALEQAGLSVLIGRKDFVDLRKSGMATFFRVVPKELIVDRDEQLHIYKVAASGYDAEPSTFFFSDLKDADSLGSQEFAAILVIEAHEITEETFRKLRNRARQGMLPSFVIMEGNPPSEGHWLAKLTNRNDPAYDPSITVFELPSTENWHYMTRAYRQTLEAMPPSWRRRYLLGKTGFLPAGTPVYSSFIESLHVRSTKLIPDRPLIRSWDFGFRRAACSWMQLTDAGHLLVHREWMALETPETEFIEGVKTRTNEWFGPRACVDYGDPAARNRDPEGISTLVRLQAAGIKLVARQSTYSERIPLINQRLSQLIDGKPAVAVDPQCPILIEGLLGGYHYPEIDPDKKFTQAHEIPDHDQWFSHLMNALEYAFVNLFLGTSTGLREQHRESRHRRVEAVRQRRGVVSFLWVGLCASQLLNTFQF